MLNALRSVPSKQTIRRAVPRLLEVECLEARCLLSYSITDLGDLGGVPFSGASINSSGQIAGEVGTRAFRYDPGIGFTDIGGNTYVSTAVGINDSGEVIGNFRAVSGGDYKAYRTAPNANIDPSTDDLGDLGGGFVTARGINNKGWVAGDSALRNYRIEHAFLFVDGMLRDLGAFDRMRDFPFAQGTAVNDLGQVIGYSWKDDGHAHAFIYEYGTMMELGRNINIDSRPFSINNSGQVVGYIGPDGDHSRATLWDITAGQIDLGSFGGTFNSALHINNLGQIVGFSEAADGYGHAFIYEDGRMADLNNLIPPDSHWQLRSGSAINDNGQILGYGINPDGHTHTFVLTPDKLPQAEFSLTPSSAPDGVLTLLVTPIRAESSQLLDIPLLSNPDAQEQFASTPSEEHARATEVLNCGTTAFPFSVHHGRKVEPLVDEALQNMWDCWMRDRVYDPGARGAHQVS